MNQKRLSEDLANMEEVLSRTADRCDIWQDRLIHAMARAIYDILVWILKHSNKYIDGGKAGSGLFFSAFPRS